MVVLSFLTWNVLNTEDNVCLYYLFILAALGRGNLYTTLGMVSVFMHVPILRQILSWLEQPEGGPTEEQRQRAGGHETNVHVASHADLLMFGAGKRAERGRVFIEMVEGFAVLSFAAGGLPRLPGLCEAHDAERLACAFADFKATEQSHAEIIPEEEKPGETEPVG